MNDLLKVAEKFLIFEQTKNTEEHNPILLFPELNDRKQFLLYEKRLKSTEKKLKAFEKHGLEYHNQYYNIQKEKAALLFKNNALGKEDNYRELLYHIDIKYLLEKLQYHLAQLTLQQKYPNKAFDFEPYKACEALFNLPQYKQNPLIKLYLLNINLVEKADDDTYNLLFNALQEYRDIIPASFLRPFYVNLHNYCAFQIAEGKLDFYQELKKIFEVKHSQNILTNDNVMDISILKNIVTIGCRLKEFDWANKMLIENIEYVSENLKESVLSYNKGVIAFYMRNFCDAQDHFLKVGMIDEFHSTNLKATQLQCYYEIEQHYNYYIQQMIESFRIFLTTTKKLSPPQKASYKKFTYTYNNLYNFRKIIGKKERCIKIKRKLPDLIDFINNEQFVWNREWLLSKAKVLKNDCV